MLGPECQNLTVPKKERGEYLSQKLNEVAAAHGTTVHAWAVDAGVLPSAVFGAIGGHRGLSETIIKKLAGVEKMGVTVAQIKAWMALSDMDPEARAYVLSQTNDKSPLLPPASRAFDLRLSEGERQRDDRLEGERQERHARADAARKRNPGRRQERRAAGKYPDLPEQVDLDHVERDDNHGEFHDD